MRNEVRLVSTHFDEFVQKQNGGGGASGSRETYPEFGHELFI